ncbi:cadherin-like and PC-esterase domain-containing protein 1 isoform X3 [Acropora millepora]|uniref:cadherin-like and PC-esterase domain-containing protein 1 isoform X3 n=1 Tax=Acropora millepora TaxID=45264 RepID=UPI001CF18F07|nr:cadherin-like and PC-esterase domain-containing protein 1 isoform X3 [Acropora millepora]
MRIFQLHIRKNLLFLALITIVCVLWTCWVGSFLQSKASILSKGFQGVKEALPHKDLQKPNGLLRINEAFAHENKVVERVRIDSALENSEIASITDNGLLRRLQELEGQKLLKELKILLITPSHSRVEDDLAVFRQTFGDLGYKVFVDTTSEPSFVKQFNIVWCLPGNGTSPCSQKNHLDVYNIQKISPAPGMDKLLFRNDGFCFLMTASKLIPALQDQVNLSLPCYVLPAQGKKFPQDKGKKESLFFTLKTLGSDVTPPVKWGALDSSTLDLTSKGVLQFFPSDVLLIDGNTVILQVYVLETFVSPLRVYRHNEGLVIFADKGKGSVATWNLGKFIQYLEISYGASRATEVIKQMDDLIVKMLLILEPSLFTYFMNVATGSNFFRCQGCFQPIKVSFAFSSKLEPFILEAKAVAFDSVSTTVVQDTINLLFKVSSVPLFKDVYQMLETLNLTSLFKKMKWSDIFLSYLLETKQEAYHMGNFQQLYPSTDDSGYREVIHHLSDSGEEILYKQASDLRTADVHEILRAFVKLHDHKVVDNLTGLKAAMLSEGSTKNVMCSDDPDALPLLQELNTEPTVHLSPQFSSEVYTYQATVSFDNMVLQIWGKVSNCHLNVRINTKYEDNQASNHSLGVGWNKFSIYVVDTTRSTLDTMAVYSLFVFRERRSEMENTFEKESHHEVCVHHQECSLIVYPSKPCGLEKLSEESWTPFLQRQSELSACETAHEPGRWVLPCISCSNSSSCYWRQAVWAPHSCHYNVTSKANAKKCLANKKILFVGDSTNRGIMYYLMEKLNGSLRKWEKTHSMKIYSDELNGGRTSVSFAYYPQFWLPENKRPVFVKALYQLIARFLPLQNNSNTILVVGGVQWMNAHHITETNKALISLGLNGIKVIVKSLGSGFHLPVPGLRRHELGEQQMTTERNRQVINAAKLQGYEVVDTFGMTISRYKDFLMGNCGCHFHKVVNMRSLIREKDEMPSPLLDNTDDKDAHDLPRYHVIGPINSVYSELTISRMCN